MDNLDTDAARWASREAVEWLSLIHILYQTLDVDPSLFAETEFAVSLYGVWPETFTLVCPQIDLLILSFVLQSNFNIVKLYSDFVE